MSWTIKGHTVQSDGMVYDPDSAGWGYVPSDYRAVSKENPQHAVYVAPPSKPQAAAGVVKTGPNGGGSGPGSASVKTTQANAGGSGPGSSRMVGAWWGKVGESNAPINSWVTIKELPPLDPVMENQNTFIQIGGVPFGPHPGTSDAGQIEEMLGDGDSPMDLAWYFKQAAALSHIGYNINLWANDPDTKKAAKDFDDAVVNALSW